MKQLLQEMEQYAQVHNVPIMQEEGLSFMVQCIQDNHVQTILELGTAIAYSTIRLANVREDIRIVSIERDTTRYEEACKNVKEANLEDRITLIHGDALEVEVEGTYDMIFIDAAKAQYIKFFEKYAPLLSDTGIIISDNLSFHGMVEDIEHIKNRNTKQLVKKIQKFIVYLKEHKEYATTFYEVGDGVAITRKKRGLD